MLSSFSTADLTDIPASRLIMGNGMQQERAFGIYGLQIVEIARDLLIVYWTKFESAMNTREGPDETRQDASGKTRHVVTRCLFQIPGSAPSIPP